MGGFASSKVLEVHGERMVKRTFEPDFRIELHQKDLNLANFEIGQKPDSSQALPHVKRRHQDLRF